MNTQNKQNSPEQAVTRRDMIRSTLSAAASLSLSEAIFSGSAAIAQEQIGQEHERTPQTQLEALTVFAEQSAAIAVQLDGLDVLVKRSGNSELQKNWKEAKPLVIQALHETQEIVIARMRQSYNRPGQESEHTAAISNATGLLAPHQQSLRLLALQLEQEHPKTKNDRSEPKPSESVRTPRTSGFRLEVASPFEAALEDTGILDKLAGSISNLAEKGLLPLLDKIQSSEGGLNFSDISNKNWRGRLNLKRKTRPGDVIPEQVFEAVLNHASQRSAIESVISRIESSSSNNDTAWEKTKLSAEKTISNSEKQLAESVSTLLEGSSRPKRGDLRESMATLKSAQAGLRTASLLVESHARILEVAK